MGIKEVGGAGGWDGDGDGEGSEGDVGPHGNVSILWLCLYLYLYMYMYCIFGCIFGCIGVHFFLKGWWECGQKGG